MKTEIERLGEAVSILRSLGYRVAIMYPKPQDGEDRRPVTAIAFAQTPGNMGALCRGFLQNSKTIGHFERDDPLPH